MADSIRFRVQNIRMTNNIRVFLWLGLALAVWLNYSQWQMDYGPKPGTPTRTTSAPGEPKPPSSGRYCPAGGLNQPLLPRMRLRRRPYPGPSPRRRPRPRPRPRAGKVRVTTDVLVMDIDLRGGTLVYAELPAYPLVKGQRAARGAAQPVQRLD